MKKIKVLENLDRRYLGALRFVDNATGGLLSRPLIIEGEGLKLAPNRSGLLVIHDAKGLESHLDKFEKPPDIPAHGTLPFTLNISDPSGEYLPRTATLALPRNSIPAEPEGLSDQFIPVDLRLFQAPAAGLSSNWSIIRASVFDATDEASEIPVQGALIRVIKQGDGKFLNSGLSDQRGEALIALPGIPITNFSQSDSASPEPGADTPGGGPPETPPGRAGEEEENAELNSGSVTQMDTTVTLEVVVKEGTPWPADPQELEINKDNWNRTITKSDPSDDIALTTGDTQSIKLFIDMTPNV